MKLYGGSIRFLLLTSGGVFLISPIIVFLFPCEGGGCLIVLACMSGVGLLRVDD